MINVKPIFREAKRVTNINRHKNLLIIAPASTDHEVGNICYYESADNVKKYYGDSELTNAYLYAKNYGVKDIFLLNARRFSDYINCKDVIYQNDFSYIVPIGLKFSDTYIDKNSRKRLFVEDYIKSVNSTSNSMFVMTDEHSSLYDSEIHFCDEMNNKVSFVIRSMNGWYDGKHMILVANNLSNNKHANLTLACSMSCSELGKYPELTNDEDVDMNLYWTDFFNKPFAYFYKDIDNKVSIENLKNLRLEVDAISDANIYRTIAFLLRDLDMSAYEGKLHSERIMHSIRKKLEEYFSGKRKTHIRDYNISSLNFKKIAPAAGRVEATIDVLPINSIERYTLELVF